MSALDTQVAGDHYKKLKIQPAEYCHANKIPKLEGDAIYYITRWRDKGGLTDLHKAIHTIQLLIDLEIRAMSVDEEEPTVEVSFADPTAPLPGASAIPSDAEILMSADKIAVSNKDGDLMPHIKIDRQTANDILQQLKRSGNFSLTASAVWVSQGQGAIARGWEFCVNVIAGNQHGEASYYLSIRKIR